MREVPCPGWNVRLALAAAVACIAMSSPAQVPGFPSLFPDPLKPATSTTAPTKVPVAGSETREQLELRLRRQSAAIEAARAQPTPPPDGIRADEVTDLEDARTALLNANAVQLHTAGELDKARVAREAAEAAAKDWKGFDAPPPYSIQLADELRESIEAARARLDAIQRSTAHLRGESERYTDETRRAEEALRRLQEAVDRAPDEAERQRATWRRDLAQTRLRALASRAGVTQLLLHFQAEEAATREAEIALLERKLATANRDARFDEADVARAKARLAAQVTALRGEQKAIGERIEAREKERAAADQALARLREQADSPRDDVRVAQARLEAAEAWLAALRAEREALDGLATLYDDQARNWEARLMAVTAAEGDVRYAAGERLRAAASRLVRFRGYVENLLSTQRVRLADAEAAVKRSDVVAAAVPFEQDRVNALRRTLATYQRVEDALASGSATLDRWVADIDARQGQGSAARRLAEQWSALKAWARDVWNFELFAVEDSTIVDGTEVKTSRGVTVGKSLGAFVVFIAGYWIAAVAGRRLERRFVERGFDARRVRNWRRWALVAVAALLALFTLNIARIPLTVFAFLGGALAIGVGFGTQTIIRNFISGLIVLAERRIQIGDIIEVDGVTGTVTAVDLRSSTVLGFDGVETSVPNAVLLENKVTNWTQSDKRVRRAVKVGVAYGSPLRDVAAILEECAQRHGVVLTEPAPQVIFEDFGADALVFALYFWVDLKPGVNAAQIASDLRHMIARRFEEAGIAIAYPQRDVHLDAAQPLRVEMVEPRRPARAA